MKPFSIWAIITLMVFGTISGAYHVYLSTNPRKILVAVDSSFSMNSVWSQVSRQLDAIDDRRYALFSLITEKNSVHSWSPSLQLGQLVPYAPRNFSKLSDPSHYRELTEADEKYLITDSEGAQIAHLQDWTVLKLP